MAKRTRKKSKKSQTAFERLFGLRKNPPRGKKACAKKACRREREPSCAPRFTMRKLFKTEGVFDRGAGAPNKRRGRFVKRSGLGCRAPTGENAKYIHGILSRSEAPDAGVRFRGRFRIHNEGGKWVLYDQVTGTLLHKGFKTYASAASWAARGATKHACAGKGGAKKTRKNPPAYLTGEVVGVPHGGSLEQRVSRLERKVDGHDVALRSALARLAGRRHRQLSAG